MRSTVKKVEFDTPFRYSYSGGFQEATAIYVVEPNLANRKVHLKLQGLVGEAVKAIVAERRDDKPKEKPQIEQSDEVAAPSEEPVDPAAAAAEDDVNVAAAQAIGTMQSYLSADRYCEYAEFTLRALTANVALCYIQTEDGKKVSVREESWDSIVTNGGMSDLDRVVGAFTSFFTDPPPVKSTKKSGSGSPST
jgi:hypothetical protein